MTPLKRNIAILILIIGSVSMCVSKRGYYSIKTNSFSKDSVETNKIQDEAKSLSIKPTAKVAFTNEKQVKAGL